MVKYTENVKYRLTLFFINRMLILFKVSKGLQIGICAQFQ